MKKTDIKAVVFDLDGTLLNPEHQLSEACISAVSMLRERGIPVILATGRSYESLYPFKERLHLDSLIICYNGACIMDAGKDIPVENSLMNESNGRQLVDIARKAGVHFQIFRQTELLYEHPTPEAAAYEKRAGVCGRIVSFDVLDSLEITKSMFIASRETLEKVEVAIRSEINDDLYITFSDTHFLEVMRGGVSKGRALTKVAERMNLSLENFMAFGDGNNDYEMLSACGHPVAMGNASSLLFSIPGVNRALSNARNGAAVYIEEFFG